MFSTITTAPSTTIPKSSAPSESRLAGICLRSRQIDANSSENGMVSGHDERAANVAEEQKQNDRHQDEALGQVVQHGVGGELHQIAAIDEGNDLYAGRQNMVVQLLHFLMQSFERRFGIGAFPHRHPRGNHIVVVDDLSVFTANGPAELAEPDLRTLRHHRDILHAERRAALGRRSPCSRCRARS